MERYIPKTFRQFLALLLCAAMLVPMIPAPAFATEAEETTAPAVTGSPEAAPETTTPATEETVAPEDKTGETDTESSEPDASEPTEAMDFALFVQAPDIVLSEQITIPGYLTTGSVSQPMTYDCGNGVANDGSKSYLTIVTDTDSAEFLYYVEQLEQRGYALKDDKVVEITSDDPQDPNRFASFTSPDGSYKLYTYHFPFYRETRIIVDTQEDTVEGFYYQAGEHVTTPMLAMYGLSMSENGYDITSKYESYRTGKRNCGALIVIRMPDNSLFIHDGGDIHQWSDAACDEFLAFCRKLTGTTGTNKKMVINTYFLSHAHEDHFGGFPRLINKYHDHFDLKNIMYNIDIERTYTTRDIHNHMQLISSFYPNVRYDGLCYHNPTMDRNVFFS